MMNKLIFVGLIFLSCRQSPVRNVDVNNFTLPDSLSDARLLSIRHTDDLDAISYLVFADSAHRHARRIVFFSDGSSTREQLLSVNPGCFVTKDLGTVFTIQNNSVVVNSAACMGSTQTTDSVWLRKQIQENLLVE